MIHLTGNLPAYNAGSQNHGFAMLNLIVGAICLGWYLFILSVCTVGYIQIQRYYSSLPKPPTSASLPLSQIPHVTILRPVNGLEPLLYECLAATFHQSYPREKLTISFCISSRRDLAIGILERLLHDFPGFDARIFVEEEDPNLSKANGHLHNLGPNPKIRNLSRAYREAKGDVVWIIDCNVWVGKGVVGRMVDKLYGLGVGEARKYKFVHLLPLVVDIDERHAHFRNGLISRGEADEGDARRPSSSILPKSLRIGGGRLEELFISSSHAKFYTAINTVAVAPCIVGKSTMFRRSHLNHLTKNHTSRPAGLDFFSENICEDHLIGDLLWHGTIPSEPASGKVLSWGNHGLVFGDLAIQPMAGMSVEDYIARRVRWLRVRKFTVILATLVEPGTESLLCSLYGAYAVTNLPIFYRVLGIPPTWHSFYLSFFTSIILWACVDWTLYLRLHAGASTEVDSATPGFAQRPKGARRPFVEWLAAWIVRELLAWPIWVWAVFGGATVVWRGQKMWVGFDMRVHKVKEAGRARID